jgi:hypothetical protein
MEVKHTLLPQSNLTPSPEGIGPPMPPEPNIEEALAAFARAVAGTFRRTPLRVKVYTR